MKENTWESLDRWFWPRVNKTDACWLWTGAINGWGYGSVRMKCKSFGAHAISYRVHKGEIPKGLEIMHSCDVRACVNPEHLSLGTKQDNKNDCVRKERQARGETNGHSSLTKEQVLRIAQIRREKGWGYKKIAKETGLGSSAISHVLAGRTWSFVTGF